ncbi:MAG TPA: LLM class F420-dependent oxidoreductase, partial [Actinomycetota bacterium]|nr:LLM class F420-dependent oxidoreductase [Actinomycetota bacterium]
EQEAGLIRDLYLSGRRREAAASVPDALVDEVALVGSIARIRDRLAVWREAGVTTLLVQTRDRVCLSAVVEAAR